MAAERMSQAVIVSSPASCLVLLLVLFAYFTSIGPTCWRVSFFVSDALVISAELRSKRDSGLREWVDERAERVAKRKKEEKLNELLASELDPT